MTHIEQMIQDLCPNGVEWKKLGDLADIDTGNRNRQDAIEDGIYPFYVRSKEIFRIDSYSYDEEAIIIPGEGGIGDIFHYVNGKYDLHQRAYRIHITNKAVDTKFVYFYLTAHFKDYIIGKAVAATVTSIRKPMLQAFEIPIPPLEIQKKIVECLDKFSALAAELQAELQMRRKQYEYYRTHLLTPHSESNSADNSDDCNWVSIPLGELCDTFMGEFVHKNKQNPNGQYPVYNGGTTPTGYYDEYNATANKVIVSARGAGAGFVNLVETNFWAGNSCHVIDIKDPDVLYWRFLYYFLKTIEGDLIGHQQKGGGVPAVSKKQIQDIQIAFPSLSEQKRIVEILDKFDKLITSMEDGIPAEQAAQQKRYEYYRDLLLTFDRKAV